MFDLFLPVISKAGEYDERPIIGDRGVVLTHVAFSAAEQAGMQYINEHEEGEDMTLKVAVMKIKTVDESLAIHEAWFAEQEKDV